MVSLTADHAIRAMLALANAPDARALTAGEIAIATGTPRNYMAKVLNAVAKAGLIVSQRGPAGGFALAVPAVEIPLVRVIDLFDTAVANRRCMLGSKPCDLSRPCRAHQTWTAIAGARRAPLLSTTIADLLEGRVAASPSHYTPELHHVE